MPFDDFFLLIYSTFFLIGRRGVETFAFSEERSFIVLFFMG
jgi:hypothetical protein